MNNLDASYAFMFIYTGREINEYSKILRATEEILNNFVQQEKMKNHEKESL